MAELINRSRRPIRNAACRIEPEPGDAQRAADTVGRFAEIDTPRSRMLIDRSEGAQLELIGPVKLLGSFSTCGQTIIPRRG
jgi:hypothetical protein